MSFGLCLNKPLPKYSFTKIPHLKKIVACFTFESSTCASAMRDTLHVRCDSDRCLVFKFPDLQNYNLGFVSNLLNISGEQRAMSGNHACEGDHDHDESPEMGLQYSLYAKIDTDNLECLNEAVDGSGKNVFKPWEERMNFEKYVESDSDEELIFNIPFTGNVKLKGIVIIGGDQDSHPSQLKLFKNRPHMTFDDVHCCADQEFELHPDRAGTIEYSTKVVKFSSVHHLTLYFPRNFGCDTTTIYYIGLRGEFTEAHRHGVTICTYEAKPNISDHKTNSMDVVPHHVS